MDNETKTGFITSLIDGVRDVILSRVREMPESWDGIEVRQYIADEFSRHTIKMDRGRKMSYNNECRINHRL